MAPGAAVSYPALEARLQSSERKKEVFLDGSL